MRSQRDLLVLVLALTATAAAVGQSNGALRWRSGGSALGLQPAASGAAMQCGPFTLACDGAAVVPLYASRIAPRTLSMQVGTVEGGSVLKMAHAQGLSLALVGKAGLFQGVGVYGRVGTVMGRGSGLAGSPGANGGVTYGVGLSWDFARTASAVLGFDSYDVHGTAGDLRDVRATRLGLQWRY